MAPSKALPPRHRWLLALTDLPTAPGREDRVIEWVDRWVSRRPEIRRRRDGAGNLLLTLEGRRRRPPVLAVAHLDHPAFVVNEVSGRTVTAEFRGGVAPPYFEDALVEFVDGLDAIHPARVVEHGRSATTLQLRRGAALRPGDVGRWRFDARRLGIRGDRIHARACDDLAGVAAALSALDIARRKPDLHHLGVLLTRAEEVGFVGAIASAKLGTIPEGARLLSIECSRSFPDSPIGGGPIVRVGDHSSVFDAGLTNAVTAIVRERRIPHQRKLMDGGSCEATAFGAYGHVATGLCLPLANYHNMVDIDGVAAGVRPARVGPESISLSDYDGLVKLILAVTAGLPRDGDLLTDRLDRLYDEQRRVLDRP